MPAQMKTPLMRTLIAAAALCASLFAPTLASAAPTLPDFSAATFVPRVAPEWHDAAAAT